MTDEWKDDALDGYETTIREQQARIEGLAQEAEQAQALARVHKSANELSCALNDNLRSLLAEATTALRGVIKAHEVITARFRAGTPKPPPEWAFKAMEDGRALLAKLEET